MQPPNNTIQYPNSPPSPPPPTQPKSPPPVEAPPQTLPTPPAQAQNLPSTTPTITKPQPNPEPKPEGKPELPLSTEEPTPSSPQPPPQHEVVSSPSSNKKAQDSSPPPGRNEAVSSSPTDVPLSYSPQPNMTPTHGTRPPESGKWSTGLFACFSDLQNCVITCFCPCITFGEISEIVDKGTTSCAINGSIYTLMVVVLGFACIYSAYYRRRMRLQYNLEGSTCGDCCVHSFCEWCALCQEHRELQHRGFNLGLGWHANMERANQGAITTPPPHSSMKR